MYLILKIFLFLQALIALPARISQSSPILEFFHPTSTDIQRPVEAAPEEKKPVDINALSISGPAKLASYRCLADFTASEKLELSLKRNTMVQVLQKHPNGLYLIHKKKNLFLLEFSFMKRLVVCSSR